MGNFHAMPMAETDAATTATTATTATAATTIAALPQDKRIADRIAQWRSLADTSYLLDLSDLSLKDFDGHLIPRTCRRLALYENKLTQIPTPLPPQLEHLFIDNNEIRSYNPSDLPDSLEVFVITKNKLTTLPSPLPPSLRLLYASNNRLKTLPTTFPSHLTNFSIHNNYVAKFPDLPPTVKLLYASFNEFHELSSSMPPSLTQCIVAGNHFLVPQTRADEEGVGLTTWIQKVQAAQEAVSKQRILARTEQIKEELMAIMFSPERVMRLLKEGLLFSVMSDYTVAEADEAQRYWID
jgi:hypothetical protein